MPDIIKFRKQYEQIPYTRTMADLERDIAMLNSQLNASRLREATLQAENDELKKRLEGLTGPDGSTEPVVAPTTDTPTI